MKPSMDTTTTTTISKKNRKRKTDSEEKLLKKYKREVARWDPTALDADVEEIVEKRFSVSIASFFKEFDVCLESQFMKFIPEGKIKKTITDIVINDVNAPIRELIYTHLPHFQQLKAVVKRRQQLDDLPATLVEELRRLDPPGDGEPPFSEFVEHLHGIMTKVIQRVAGAIESNELLRGDSGFANAVLSRITLQHNIKIRICTYLFNEICAFAGEDLYTFFTVDTKLIKGIVNRYLYCNV